MNVATTASSIEKEDRGFALVAAISMLVLLVVIAVGLLTLSAVSIRHASIDEAKQQARANARMALMVAIGELQLEMGPDMRISSEAAIQDADPATDVIDGVAQPHWTAVYDSWGNWLNADYTPEGKTAAAVSSIQDTYVAKRAPMFRRWLVSLPLSRQTDVNAAVDGLDEEESVIMIGEGTLGRAYAAANPHQVTRAYKMRSGDRSAYAWWVGPENHKAKINLAAQQRELSPDMWATAQGVASEVAIGGIEGLESLDVGNAKAAALASRIVSLKTLELPTADAGEDRAKAMFFDLTEASYGILSNSRSGGLKKDLSLLFENSDTTIAPQYTQADRFSPEPSIRPHSKDVLALGADLPRRPFASWSRMRHYYRMYRADEDVSLPSRGPVAQANRNLLYVNGRPETQIHAPWNMREYDKDQRWFGENSYLRYPVLARYLIIHAYQTQRYYEPRTDAEEVAFHYFNIPVVTYWNPYTTPLVIKNRTLGAQVATNPAWPHRIQMYQLNGKMDGLGWTASNMDTPVPLASKDGNDIVFQPGEFKVFSFPPGSMFKARDEDLWSSPNYCLREGFNPNSPGGLSDGGALYWKRVSDKGVFKERDLEVQFDKARGKNAAEGNTPGSLTFKTGLGGDWKDDGIPSHYQIDWFQVSQQHQPITNDELGARVPLVESEDMLPIGYTLLTLKSTSRIATPAVWAKDWRSRNWLHAPPYCFGSGLYMTEHSEIRAHTQRLDCPYEVSFGPTSPSELVKLTGEINGRPWLGFGSNPYEKVTAVPALELPTAPISSLASFSGMRITPGWIWTPDLNPDWVVRQRTTENATVYPISFYGGTSKQYAYQSGITGGGIGNSFVHPMIPREKIYFHHGNSISNDMTRMDLLTKNEAWAEAAKDETTPYDTKAYADYWDHGFMLNDALWDEYFISSIADQTRPWAGESKNLEANIEALTNGDGLPISRYRYHDGGLDAEEVQEKLMQDDAYLRAAEHLLVDGAFNVNSTSINAWYALFKGIRERRLYYRDASGALKEVSVPSDHIALSRFDTPTSDQEVDDVSSGVVRDDGNMAWSGVRFISDEQMHLLAQKCVEQVKRRGPFLNFAEFINRRLEESDLGLIGALQSAIDYDDSSPSPESINYRFKSSPMLMMEPSDLGDHEYPTPEVVSGSRLAGIPGYLMQSDLLKPIANTLQVRDDTFRIRAYGETLDSKGRVIARAWCEAIVQRMPEYVDPANGPYEAVRAYEGNQPAGPYDPLWDGQFVPNGRMTPANLRFGRKFEMKSFRWLASEEI